MPVSVSKHVLEQLLETEMQEVIAEFRSDTRRAPVDVTDANGQAHLLNKFGFFFDGQNARDASDLRRRQRSQRWKEPKHKPQLKAASHRHRTRQLAAIVRE